MPEVKGFKYAYSVGQINDLLDKIKETGRPDKLTLTYVQNTWLLKNAQYTAVIDILKDMGFLAPDGIPTDMYAQFQNPEHSGQLLAQGVKKLIHLSLKLIQRRRKCRKKSLRVLSRNIQEPIKAWSRKSTVQSSVYAH
jgi:hypothetical protein